MSAKNFTRLFIGNLPWTVGHQELRKYFREFGKIAAASVVVDRNTGISKGYGFVTFFNSDSYERITNQKSHNIDGWNLIIQRSTGTPKNS
ncbi:heterogeneous nuclear ribonucleoprotein A/B-like [Homalodisca vitripennis]|uniref:heterogeneous nuclear ribonucleoprotein A/B-like n=1 Tax=Homalodisca vitripennis TaxID=197043 RepID=UPI001EEB5CAE|nr:heterogeneous nuclear ribonucleoprotein A/B-like [Homalodisca vitripennis]